MAKIDTDFKVGKPTSRSWSGVLGYRPETDTLITIFGEMFAVMSIRSEIDFDLANVGGLLFDELQQSYFSEFKRTIELADFESAVGRVKSRIDAILEREHDLSQTGVDLEMAISVVKGQVLYLAVIGESKVFIRRGDSFAEIGGALIDGEMDGFMRTGSMYLASEDSVLLMTGELAAKSEDEPQKITKDFTFKSTAVSQGAGLLIGYDHAEKEIAAEPHHELLPADPDFNDEEEYAIEPTVPVALAPETAEDEELTAQQEVLAEQDEFADESEIEPEVKPKYVQPLGHLSDDEDEELDELPPIRRPIGHVQSEAEEMDEDEMPQMGDIARGVAAGSMLDKLKPLLAKITPILANLKLQAGKAAGSAKSSALQMKNKAMAGRGGSMNTGRISPVAMHTESHIDEIDDMDEQPRHLEIDETDGMVPEITPIMDRNARLAAARNSQDRVSRVGRPSSGNKAQDIMNMVVAWFKTNILGQTDKQQVYLRGGRGQRNWRVLAVIGLVVVVVLVLGIRKVSQDHDYQTSILTAQSKIKELGNRFDDLNVQVTTLNIGNTDVTKKSDVINSLNKLMNDARTVEQDKIFATEPKLKTDVDNLITRAQAAQDQAGNIIGFTQPQVVTDVGVNFQGVDLAHLTYSNGKIYVEDKGRGVIYRMGTALNSETTAFVSGLTNPYLLKATPSGDLVVVDDNPDSAIATIDINNGNIKRMAGLSKAKIGTLSAIDIWTNDALYSTNPIKQALLKQENAGGNYALPNDNSPWRSDPDFANSTDIAVDYWIYVLVRGKGIVRYSGGQPDDFTLEGLLPADKAALNQATAIDITATNLYVADPLNKRVLQFTKSTTDNKIFTFKQQYVYRGTGAVFTKIKDIVANEETKKLFVLDGTQVIRLDL